MILIAVNKILNSSAELKAYTGEQIYAVLIDADVSGNMVAFNAESNPAYTKSGNSNDLNSLDIYCISPSYNDAANMAQIVRGVMAGAASVPQDEGTRILGAKVEYITRSYDAKHKEYSLNLRVQINSKIN